MVRKNVTPGRKPSSGLLKKLGIGILGGVVGGLLTFGGLYLAMGSSLTSPVTTATSGVQDNNGQTKVSNVKYDVNSDVTKAVEKVQGAVVSIINLQQNNANGLEGVVGSGQHGGQGSGTENSGDDSSLEASSEGSGVIYKVDGDKAYIVTNNHVVEGSSTLTVTFVDEESVEAQVKGTNSNIDLAVVAVQLDQIKDSTMKEIKTATLGDSDAIRVGEPAIAIGNALGYGQSVTNGIISAKDRTVDGFETTLIQTNAAINPGNSGGALLNAKGEVIGINTVKVNADAVEGMGYAIPISDVTDVINDLMNRQTRTKVDESERGALGISGTDVDSQSAQVYNMPEGVFISDVTKDGGAEKAGLTKGSIITEFDGTKIDSMDTLKSQLEYYKAGETVDVTVQVPEKNGEYKEQTVQVTLGEAAK